MSNNIATNGFIAYPSEPAELGRAIEAAVRLTRKQEGKFGTWRYLPIGGQLIPSKVHEGVKESSIFVADITYLNLNVIYEIGLAVGYGKPLALLKNSALKGNASEAMGLGVLDTIGQDFYANSTELSNSLIRIANRAPLVVEHQLNQGMPAYIILPKAKNDFALRIISRLKRLKLTYRLFDAGEQTTLGASECIQQVSESYGIIVTLLQKNHPEHFVHNLRSMFVAGLATALGKPIALLSTGVETVPMDVADIAQECRFPQQIDEAIQNLATDITVAFQKISKAQERPKTNLEKIDLGASSAENELSKLGAYYLATEAFQKTLRGEARLVVGRKGSGKSALFFQVRERLIPSRENLVIDLKPDGFQLISLKESLAPILSEGALEHIVTAFWEYILFCEIGREYLKDMELFAKRDPDILSSFERLESLFHQHGLSVDGDFSERIVASLRRIEEQVAELSAKSAVPEPLKLSSPEVTAIVHRGVLQEIQKALTECLKNKSNVWILFDNIDKGWPAHGLTATDIMVVRTLQDAARKVSRSLDGKSLTCNTIVFLRNDVFELLVSETPDRGKEARVLLDWNDREALRELVNRRLVFSGLEANSFAELWGQMAAPFVKGQPSFDFLLDHCLMRPRFLLDLINHCRSFAVNAGHQIVEGEDFIKGLRVFSSELVMDIGFEIADVLGSKHANAGEVLMKLVGCDQILNEAELLNIVLGDVQAANTRETIKKILLWHGVVGLSSQSGDEASYIYDFDYNYPLMEASIKKAAQSPGGAFFRINDAFSSGLRLATLS